MSSLASSELQDQSCGPWPAASAAAAPASPASSSLTHDAYRYNEYLRCDMGPFSALASILRPRTALELQRLTPRRFSANGATDKRYQELCNLSYWQNDLLSGLELDQLPSLQVDAVPIVHHPLYSAPQLQQGHRFPMQIFQRIHDSLIQDDVVQPEQVRTLPCVRGLSASSMCNSMLYAVCPRDT